MSRKFWAGLLNWFEQTLVVEDTISVEDFELFEVLDTPRAVVDAIFQHYEERGFEPSAEERERLLML
ncbi:MAG: hypothetical protein L3J89_02870 [Gammaproteobacteria bacterium]|nr:hypothetical protein [Gammaproteobacteria bacterium]